MVRSRFFVFLGIHDFQLLRWYGHRVTSLLQCKLLSPGYRDLVLRVVKIKEVLEGLGVD